MDTVMIIIKCHGLQSFIENNLDNYQNLYSKKAPIQPNRHNY